MRQWLLALVLAMVSACAAAAVNLNTASKDELVALPGIGPAKAQAILDYRAQHGGFRSVEEVKDVKGIGAKRYERLKAELTVSPLRPATAKADAHGPAAKGDIKATADARAHK
jgi:competence protein ComEA